MPETQLHIEKDITLEKLREQHLQLENDCIDLRRKKHKIIYDEHVQLEAAIQKLRDYSQEKTKILIATLNDNIDIKLLLFP